MKIGFIICARAGSKGFPNKNIAKMNGIPLVNYAIGIIELWGQKNKEKQSVIISTDSSALINQIKQTKSNWSNFFFVDRPDDLSGDEVPKFDVIKHAYLNLKSRGIIHFDYLIDLDITSPIRRLSDLERLLSDQISVKSEIQYTVTKSRRSPYFNMVEVNKDGFSSVIINQDINSRQGSPETYDMTAAIYSYDCSIFSFIGKFSNAKQSVTITIDSFVLDIDHPEDLENLEFLLSYLTKDDLDLNSMIKTARSL